MLFYIIVTAILIIPSYLSYCSKQYVSLSQSQPTTRSMFILAHPDDEVMFMVYEIDWESQRLATDHFELSKQTNSLFSIHNKW